MFFKDQVAPFCAEGPCSCSSGYELVETSRSRPICRLISKPHQEPEEDHKCRFYHLTSF